MTRGSAWRNSSRRRPRASLSWTHLSLFRMDAACGTSSAATPTRMIMVHNVALVLGGGGAAGNAWMIGIIAGLADAGLDLTEAADLVIGTSSGATAAAHVRSGIPPADLFASVLAEPAGSVAQNRAQ